MRPTNAARFCPCCPMVEPHRQERRAGKLEAREGLAEYLDSPEDHQTLRARFTSPPHNNQD